MHEALDAFGDLHKGAEVHDLGDRTFDLRTDRELAQYLSPRIAQRLLETEGNAALLGLDRENDRVDQFALLHDIAGDPDLLAPGHFRDVNEALNAGLEFDKCTELRNAGHLTGNALAELIASGHGLPRLRLQLLEPKGDLFGCGIDFENPDLQFLADRQYILGLIHAAPRDVAHVQQAVDAAQVDERAV